jgi:3-hydroxyisobutyrate dehydrogenase-like beta-hydroxyacid dehydrogenase
MKKIGFIGIGIMGEAMAANLLKAGYEVCVYARKAGKAQALAALGATVAATPAEVAAQSEAVVVMVKADADVEEIVMGKAGIVVGASPGLYILNGTTILPSTSKRLAAAVAARGIVMLDCPVTGSAPQAKEGKLTFIVGGDAAAFEACKPVMLAMGKAAFHLGASGSGSYAKLANNAMYVINLLSFVEAVSIASKSGIDPERFIEIVSLGGARSAASESKLPTILARDFSPAFSLAMMNKDLGLVKELAAELGVTTPVFDAVKAVMGQALAKGWGEEDLSSVVKLYEEANGHVLGKS